VAPAPVSANKRGDPIDAMKSLWGPSVAAALGFLFLLGLGTWQIERLHWKEGLIAQRNHALHDAPVAPPENLDEARALEFHPIHVSGHFLNDREMPVAAIAHNGEAGFHILTPFALENGEILLIDRGFVPVRLKNAATRSDGLIEGETMVTGLLRVPERPGFFTPTDRPSRNEWFTVDPAKMAAALGLDNVLPFTLDADATPVLGGYPRGGQTITALPNDHMQYAITWYALAGGLGAVYIVFIRRRLKDRT
jgi:surfeit locus 1 family protein